ncbi:MAG: zinc ribbon domain-containing protein [Candidatus Dadabacteria bacterium]|nr:zinc ribbon domain-containing protein [Candidatus Dadabacteria bacterium]MDE0663217.1 zinc ribbon domain-containing protein [Candidatus Dadabacteria bacterium]
MPERGILKKLSDFFLAPPRIDSDELRELLGEDDSVLITVQTLSCTYKPKTWIDRNAFFRSILVLTKKRILILKNSSRVNVLREIELDTITHHKFGSTRSKGLKLEIKTVDAEDVIMFHQQYRKEFEELSEKFEEVITEAISLSTGTGETFFCMHCGVRIPAASVFCSSCGKKVKL